MSVEIIEFTAHRNDMPGPDSGEAELRVDATLRFNTGGWRLSEVRILNPGINPRMLRLEVEVSGASSGAPEVIDDQQVSWFGPAGEISEVELRVVGDAEVADTVEVTPAS